MNTLLSIVLPLIIGGALGAFLSAFHLKGKNLFNFQKKQESANELILQGEKESEKIKSEIKSYVQKKKESIAQYVDRKEQRITKLQQLLNTKEQNVQKREERLKQIKLELASYKESVQSLQESTKRMDQEFLEQLSEKTGLKPQELKEKILKEEIQGLQAESVERATRNEEVIKETAEKEAKRIITSTIQRLCSATSVETRAVTIKVPKDHIKGKIVGKDGVNIAALEEELNVDIVFNDLPNTISVSAFNMVERRIAQVTLEKLTRIRGEITPSVVKKTIEEARKDTDKELYKMGKNALDRMGIKHQNEEFIITVGRLHYRTSYGQNIMKHSMEVGWLCRMLGNEIGLNEQTCLIAGFLHDIGKAVDQDPNVKDCHDFLTKEIMEKHGFSWEEVHAAWVHHDAEPQQTPEALLVKAADAISASRPGARQESFEKYLERIQDLEFTATSYEGVRRAYAISAGREIRVMVDSEKIKDPNTIELAEKIARQVEDEIVYPGKIKINVIRRTKHIEIANK